LEGEYDLGWSRNSDGSFDLIADLWGVAKKHNQTELINSINHKYAVLILNLWGLISSPECRVSTGLSGPLSPTEVPWKRAPQRVKAPYVI